MTISRRSREDRPARRGRSERASSGGTSREGASCRSPRRPLARRAAPLLRSGAEPSQVAALAGPVGLSRAGLEALTRGLGDKLLDPALEAYRRPRARIEEGLAAAPLAHAAIDVSDGLALDASRLAKASGVGVVIDAEKLLGAMGDTLSSAARVLSLDPLELALFGGEDFALFASFDAGAIATGFVPIGRFVAERGLWLELADGTQKAIEPRGFDHFRVVNLDVDAVANRSGETRPEAQERDLPAVPRAKRCVRAFDEARIGDDAGAGVAPVSLHLAAHVAGGDARSRRVAEALHLAGASRRVDVELAVRAPRTRPAF